jgi:hypothetical protein
MEPKRKELILAGAVLLALPLLVEVGLRIAEAKFEPQLYEPNRGLGWKLRPGASGVVTAENRQVVRINSQGFRDRERSYHKPEETFRIAVLGNSWTEALQVPLERAYPAVLESDLQKNDCFKGKRAEVLNFGVAGYSTGQELLVLQQEVWKYKPDVVLLAFYPARDIANNIRGLNNAANPEQSPYYVYRSGELVEDTAFRELLTLQPRQIALQNMRYTVNDHVKVLQAVNALQRGAKLRLATAAAKERAEKLGVENLEYSIYAPPLSDAMKEAWRVTEGLLAKMRDEVKGQGAAFRVVVLATRPQVLPDLEKRAELQKKLGVNDFSYADKRIQEFGAKQNIPVTLLSPVLSAYAEEHRLYLNGFNEHNWGIGHWNETGHRLAAEAILTDLCDGSAASGKAGEE